MSESRANQDTREDVYSKAVRAGKRTYFFDVKSTRKNDLYLTITESKKRFSDNGDHFYEKHKLFLYKEDFDKFIDGLQDTIDEIRSLRNGEPDMDDSYSQEHLPDRAAEPISSDTGNSYTDVNFDDLDER
jgi:hypothetical protein